ncbi:hypothetical protein [Paraburkholderia silvatlantica]|uniref:hypothetical protein n=1 Tax=Paraburkholderia silvatlantica TaxID=321895 RepID=UPI003751BE6A
MKRRCVCRSAGQAGRQGEEPVEHEEKTSKERVVAYARPGGIGQHAGTAFGKERDPGLKFAPVGKIIVSRCLAPSKRSKMLSFEGHIRRDLTVRKISKGFRMNLSDVVSE